MTRLNQHGQPVGDALDWTPPSPLRPVVLEGRWVRLEPLGPRHAAGLAAATGGPERAALWTYLGDEPPASTADFEGFVTARAARPGWVTLAVVPLTGPSAGTAAGVASWLRDDPANGVVEVGGILLGTPLQRTTAATEAMALMAAHVFATGYRRYEWKCDRLNAPSVAAARRLGFHHEGTFRQAVVVKGRTRDTDWFALTDADWTALAPVLGRWLEPGNFADPERGTGQRLALSTLTAALARPDAGTTVSHAGTRETPA